MMKTMNRESNDLFLDQDQVSNRRREPRVGGQFGLTFSGVEEGRLMMGHGQVLDLSEGGVGIRGNRLLRPGMALALFIELPDAEDHLCIPEARVSWVSGRRFGVALGTLKLEDQKRLRFVLWRNQFGVQASVRNRERLIFQKQAQEARRP